MNAKKLRAFICVVVITVMSSFAVNKEFQPCYYDDMWWEMDVSKPAPSGYGYYWICTAWDPTPVCTYVFYPSVNIWEVCLTGVPWFWDPEDE